MKRVIALAILALAAAGAHCSLTVSPSDYTSGLHAPVDAGPPTHVVVVAGLRSPMLPTEFADVPTDEVWTATIDASGAIVGWKAGPSAPMLGNVGVAVPSAGKLFVAGQPFTF
ncbi:MAG TPA: hypothetical protein VNO21_22125, partial [Polyangiaceae bacterium]|nr:hypothetical protein [Polyangiaceae bacterium]